MMTQITPRVQEFPKAKDMTGKQKINDFKRDLILQSAVKLISQKGLGSFTMDDLALDCGYTKRTLYRYFVSKDELLMFIFLNESAQKWTYQKTRILAVPEGVERLSELGKSYYDYFAQNRYFLQISVYFDYQGFDIDKSTSTTLKELHKRYWNIDSQASQIIMASIEKGKQNGQINPKIDSDFIKSYLYYTLRSMANLQLNTPTGRKKPASDKFYQEFVAILIHGLSHP